MYNTNSVSSLTEVNALPSRKVKTTEDLQMYFDKFLEM